MKHGVVVTLVSLFAIVFLNGCDSFRNDGKEIKTSITFSNNTRFPIKARVILQSSSWQEKDVTIEPCSFDQKTDVEFTVSESATGPNESVSVKVLAALEKEGERFMLRSPKTSNVTRWGANEIQFRWSDFEELTQIDGCGFNNDQVETRLVSILVSSAVKIPVTKLVFMIPRLNDSGIIIDHGGIESCGERIFSFEVDFQKFGNRPVSPTQTASVFLEATAQIDSVTFAKSRNVQFSVKSLGPNKATINNYDFSKPVPRC